MNPNKTCGFVKCQQMEEKWPNEKQDASSSETKAIFYSFSWSSLQCFSWSQGLESLVFQGRSHSNTKDEIKILRKGRETPCASGKEWLLIGEEKLAFKFWTGKKQLINLLQLGKVSLLKLMKGEEVIRSVFFKVVGAMNVIDYVFHYHPSAQIEPCS